MGSVDHKQVARSFLRMAVTGHVKEAYADYVANNFKHHNAYFPGDARSLMLGMEADNQRHPAKELRVVHTMEDGDFVAVHSRVQKSTDPQDIAVVHIFRFEGDRIAELWDVAQQLPIKSPNQYGAF